jgi:protein-S-isoprenylcysteine O-methyltransferase Ste14
MAIFSWCTLVLWLILIIYWIISAFSAKRSLREHSWWHRELGIRLVLVVVVIILIRVGALNRDEWNMFGGSMSIPGTGLAVLFGVVGVIVCAAGVAFAIWARTYLGRNWGMPMTRKEGQSLVTSGPYAYVRHPIYAGFLLAAFGTAFIDGSVWFVIFLFFAIYFIYSAKTEERLMRLQFPDEYPAYMKKTKMLIPFIW